ncbi:MAG TPA: VWA domain-containing protein, partial [Thermoanaerobaculia bacterium]
APSAPAQERGWQIVVWFDGMTMSGGTLNAAAREFSRRAPELLKLGDVTVVYADLSPETMVESTRDPKRLAQAVDTIRRRVPGDRIARIRREFLLALDSVAEVLRAEGESDWKVVVGMPVDRQIPGFIMEEDRLLHMGRANLSRWLARLPRRSPRLLVYVGDGFDIDPQEYYVRALQASGHATTDLAEMRMLNETLTKQESAELMQQLAVAGWTAIAIGGANSSFAGDSNRWTGRDNPQHMRGIAPTFMFLTPSEPLLQMAEQTGGEHITSPAYLPKALAEIGRRVRITYQVDREPDPKPRRVEIVPLRAGLTVRAARWASSTTTQEVAAARAVDLLAGAGARGDLSMTGTLREGADGSSLEAKIDLTPLGEAVSQIHATKIRMTVAIEIPGRPAEVIHRVVEIADLAASPRLSWSMPVKLPENAGAIAVVGEELITGSWGGARVTDASPVATAEAAVPRQRIAPPAAIADADQAFTRATAERKLVIAFEWSADCAACARIEQASTHPEIARLLQPFILLAPSAAAAEPRIALYDPSRRLVLAWRAIPEGRATALSTGELGAALQSAAAAAANALRAHDLFARGARVDAFLAEALALREAGDVGRAALAYAEAARLASEAGDAATAQTARVLGGMMIANQGRPDDALRELAAIAGAPASALNEAEAQLVIGMIRRAQGKEREAAAAFDRAVAVAPAGSAAHQTASAFVRGGPAQAGLASDPGASRPLQLVVSGKPPLAGTTRVQVIVRDPSVSSVAFHLDDRLALTDAEPPFEASLELGPVPRRREIRAIARDAAGGVAGEDVAIVNERHDELSLRLRQIEGSRVRAEINLPQNARMDRLEFFVDGRPVAPADDDSTAIRVDAGADGVVVRAVATLEDGRQAEDAMLVGATGYGETIEARDVEVYAAVLDPSGEFSSSMDRSQFTIEENGKKRRIAGFEFLGRAPVSVGLAIDSSDSMLEVMPDVHRSVRGFLDRIVRDGSSAFLVDFDTAPRLAAARTKDLVALHEAVSRLRADGSTAVYDAVIFGLLQLQGVPGKRALVVLTDGRDETSRYDFADAERVARESGVAIYALILGEPLSKKPWGVDPALEKLALHSGGRAWYLPDSANMDAIYDSIDLELRNQYRITYRTTPGRGASDWRNVKVAVDVAGAQVRTAAGFIAR